jgi:DNA-binding response OmpR family regulator
LVSAGLETLLRRAGQSDARTVRVESLTIDKDARTAQVDGRPVKLTRLEFDLLATLATDPRRTFTRAELTRQVWGFDPETAPPTRTLDTHAQRVRRKLEEAGAEPMVQNVRGIGWRLTR